MDKQLESVLVDGTLQEINVTITAVKSSNEVKEFVISMDRYFCMFGSVHTIGYAELETLGDDYLTHEEMVDGIRFTEGTIAGYDFSDSIKFDELINLCSLINECTTNDERMMVIDYMTCIACLQDEVTIEEIEDKLAYRDRDALLDVIIEGSMIDTQSTLFNYVDFERLTDDLFFHCDYTETPNGFIFHN